MAKRRRIRVIEDLPMKDDYAQFLRTVIGLRTDAPTLADVEGALEAGSSRNG